MPGEARNAGFFSRTVESSLAATAARRVWRDSLVHSGLLGLRRGWSAAVRDRFSSEPPTRAFTCAIRMLRQITGLHWAEQFLASAARGWPESAARRALIERTISPLEPWQRVQVAGTIVIVAGLTNAFLDYRSLVTSWPRLITWALMMMTGLLLFTACRPLAVAWRDRRRVR